MTAASITCVLIGLISMISGQQSSDEARLFAYLQPRYKTEYKYTRPLLDSDENVTVEIGMTLIDIQDFDPLTGFGTFYCFDKLAWVDEHLIWEPSLFGGLDKLRIPSDMLWKPDIVLFNSQDMVEERFHSMVVVESTGKVLWVPRTKYHIRCYEPKDRSADYECKFKFGSWVYSGLMVDPVLYMGMNKTDVENFFANHHWEIVDNYATKTMKKYDCCPEPYPDVSFYLKLNYKGPVPNGAETSVSVGSVVLGMFALFHGLLL